MMKTAEQQQRRGVLRQPRAEAHDAVAARARADDDHQPEHQQRVGEHRADDRGLRHHDLARRSAKRTMKNSGRLPSVDCRKPVTAGPEALADLLGGERDDPGQARERDRRRREGQAGRRAGVVGRPPAPAVARTATASMMQLMARVREDMVGQHARPAHPLTMQPPSHSVAGPQIGKPGTPVSHISQAYPDRVEVRGRDLAGDLMGRLTLHRVLPPAAHRATSRPRTSASSSTCCSWRSPSTG